MKFPIHKADRDEIIRFQLRSACQHCFYYSERESRCAHDWPTAQQAVWPIAGELNTEPEADISLCKEFELR